jgi:hypothetical protein
MGEGDHEAFSDASTKPMARARAPEDVEPEDGSRLSPACDASQASSGSEP